MRWYTCTPVAYKGNNSFFNRDSGLFCRAFQEIGIDSRAVMPLPVQEGDEPDLIRTEYNNLKSSEWWKAQQIDGVLLYAWTKTCYTPIAKAIHESGAKLILYFDTGSCIYPWQNWRWGTYLTFRKWKFSHPRLYIILGCLDVLRANFLTPLNYIRRRQHIEYGDLIGIPFPAAIEVYKKIPILMSHKSKSRIQLTPAPIASHFVYDASVGKENRVIAVGRWDDEEPKRPRYMMSALKQFTQRVSDVQVDIFGKIPEFMSLWHRQLPEKIRGRITLHGVIPNPKLQEYYQKAKICLCPSIHESTHLVSAEAICCGCSVVVAPCPSLSCIHWYTSARSGTIANADTSECFANAIENEYVFWERGERNPFEISAFWTQQLHAVNTLRRILPYVSNSCGSGT